MKIIIKKIHEIFSFRIPIMVYSNTAKIGHVATNCPYLFDCYEINLYRTCVHFFELSWTLECSIFIYLAYKISLPKS